MTEIIVSLHECKHSKGLGTCANEKDGRSCLACAKKNESPFFSLNNQFGLLCGSCGSVGKAEPLIERMHNRMTPMLAIVLVVGLF